MTDAVAAVSYTHLYIEELYDGEAVVVMQEFLENANAVDRDMAVSYTHLDVYKRQIFHT